MTHNEARDAIYALDRIRNRAYASRGEPNEDAAAFLRELVAAEVSKELAFDEMARIAVESMGLAA